MANPPMNDSEELFDEQPAEMANTGEPAEPKKYKKTHDQWKQRFKDFQNVAQDSRKIQETNYRYYDGEQLTREDKAELKERGQPDVVINRFKVAINGILGVNDHSRADPRALGRTPDDANSADRHEGQRERVITREHFEPGRQGVAQLVDALHRASSFLDGYDVFEILGEPRCGFHSDLDATTTGNAVENDWNLHRLSDGFEMAVETLLAGLVVVGSDKQGCISARFFRSQGQGNGFTGRIGAGACDDKTPLVCSLDGDLDNFEMFIVVECGRLSGRAHGDDA